MVNKNFILAEYRVHGKSSMDIFAREFKRQVPKGGLNDVWRQGEVIFQIERERIGRKSSKGPPYYDILRVLFPLNTDHSVILSLSNRLKGIMNPRNKPQISYEKIKVFGINRTKGQPNWPSSLEVIKFDALRGEK
jgi:hypothetical protein